MGKTNEELAKELETEKLNQEIADRTADRHEKEQIDRDKGTGLGTDEGKGTDEGENTSP